jgi:hypothetical protein
VLNDLIGAGLLGFRSGARARNWSLPVSDEVSAKSIVRFFRFRASFFFYACLVSFKTVWASSAAARTHMIFFLQRLYLGSPANVVLPLGARERAEDVASVAHWP